MKEYLSSIEEVLKAQNATPEGLTSAEAAKRLEQFGHNKLKEGKKDSLLKRFLDELADPMIIILIVAAVISGITAYYEGESFTDVIIIMAVVIINAVLGVVQESKAEAAIAALQEIAAATSKVVRDGKIVTLKSEEIVPGDIVVLEAGDSVPADGRIIESASMKIEEAALTGESVPVNKIINVLNLGGEKDVPLGDRKNMMYMGSTVVYGRGKAVITGTGMNTEMGKIADALSNAQSEETPLQMKLNQLSKILTVLVIGICAVIFAVGLFRAQLSPEGITGDTLLDTFMVAVSLAVAAIPEGLAAVVTIVLSIGVTNMSRRNAIIRKLTAVETLGCTQIICSDKTGTLTQNRMDVERVYINHREMAAEELKAAAGRRDVQLFLWAAALNNNASLFGRGGDGDPMEAALLRMDEAAGVIPEQVRLLCPRKGEQPFDSARKMMVTVNQVEGENAVFVKGAVDVLLKGCRYMANPAGDAVRGQAVREEGGGLWVPSRPMTSSDARRISEQNERWSAQGLRVLALACRPASTGREEAWLPGNLVFLGLAAMMDPPRPESRAAVAKARQAGIRPVMITGDHKVTAMAIGERVGIFREGDLAVTGAQLDQMGEEELEHSLERISVYARVSPEHKIRIVDAWQRRGNIVAMTGDGVNDAPALRKADIGVAMGIGGTEVSKDAASMILMDDNFATIIKAVANGRNVYRNIKNAIQFLLSGNMAGIFCVLYTSFRGLPLPFAPVHLLFINLLTDSLPAIAIGMERGEEGLLQEGPRDPKEGILTKAFVRILLVQGGMIGAATMWAYGLGLAEGGPGTASTMAFSALTLARLFHGFNCRSRQSLVRLGLGSNPYSLMAFGLGALLLGAVLFVPGLQAMFDVEALSPVQTAAVVCAAFMPTLGIQIGKMIVF